MSASRAEFAEEYYSNVFFFVGDNVQLRSWLRSLPDEHRNTIPVVRLNGTYCALEQVKAVTDEAIKLIEHDFPARSRAFSLSAYLNNIEFWVCDGQHDLKYCLDENSYWRQDEQENWGELL